MTFAMMTRRTAIAATVSGLAALGRTMDDAGAQHEMESFQLPAPRGRADQTMDVFFHKPADVGASASVLVVMHGNGRNARSYLRAWTALADRAGIVVLVPHFSRDLLPDSRDYNQGGMFDGSGAMKPREAWSFNIVERVFDAYKARFGSNRSSYSFYGHSAGSQFVHRFLLMMPDARVDRSVAANAGFYTMPDFAQTYPYGARNASLTEKDFRRWFGRPMTILLGDRDIDPEHVDLVRTAEANLQGPHRLARGEAFYAAAQREAQRIGSGLSWNKVIVPGVDHSNGRMAPAAARILFG